MPNLRQTTTTPRQLDLTGHVFPWRLGAPLLVYTGGCDDLFLPIFSNVAKLRQALEAMRIEYQGIKRIDDEQEFLASLPDRVDQRRVRFMVDPHVTGDGHVRFAEFAWLSASPTIH